MEYAERDIEKQDEIGNHYCKHVSAMTGEGLHSKSAIAAELAHRDIVIEDLQRKLDAALLGEAHYMDKEQAVARRLNAKLNN